MKYARVRNNKVIKISNKNFPDALPVVAAWLQPIEYPPNFYHVSAISYVVNDVDVSENKSFTLKTVDVIKSEIYDLQKYERIEAEPETIAFKGVDVVTGSNDNRNAIMSLKNGKDKKFKADKNTWLDLSGNDVRDLQDLLDDAMQVAFNGEHDANAQVDVLTTHDELKNYLER